MMRFKLMVTSALAAAGLGIGLAAAPAAVAADPCRDAVSSSRCLGPTGIGGFSVPDSSPGPGFGNGPYGPWGGLYQPWR